MEFKTATAFLQFSLAVRRHRRFIRFLAEDEFLRAVAATCRSRLRVLNERMPLWRAQLGNDREKTAHGIDVPIPFRMARMKPRPDSAFEGRANPKGIPCLYVSTTKEGAMSEVRPWNGALISLAQFAVVRPLAIVDCAVSHYGNSNLLLDSSPNDALTSERVRDIVWQEIDEAFAEPISRADDVAEYAETQILAELFKSEGYDGVAYKSAFGENAYNIALFDLNNAELLSCSLHKVMETRFAFIETGDPYYATERGSKARATSKADKEETPVTGESEHGDQQKK